VPRLTLTFDNGPSPLTTPMVLDELAARGLRAIFFVVGRQVTAPGGADLVRRAAAEGHRIGNHTMSHDVPLGRLTDPDHVAAEIEATEAVLADLGVTGQPPLFRPFGEGGRLGPHLLSPWAADHLRTVGYTVVLWNSVPVDWEPPPDAWVERALADVAARDHTVVVLHDLPSGAMDHLGRFLDEVDARGIEVTTDLPADCTPLRAGVPTPELDRWVAQPTG
jgi:peptidoglycan/xylan/chitin deacetylase (PgdA/CDA1 family)